MTTTTTPDEYARASAIITHASLHLSIERSFPDMHWRDRDAMMVDIIDRMARLRGYSLRLDRIPHEDSK